LKNDNRKYDYSSGYTENRAEYSIIAELIPEGANVIDLGCGNGALLSLLKKQKNVRERGIEISDSGVAECLRNNLNASKGRIDVRQPFNDDEFDYSICNVTIQMVNYPEVLLSEMKRISRHQIVSFPNFAFYRNRIELLLKGRMPKTMLFGYKWYSTGHVHQFSYSDFLELIEDLGGLDVKGIKYQKTGGVVKNLLMEKIPNLFQYIPIFLLAKK